ncbi:MAG: hypothetical protein OEV36_00110 [Myxococcales bacterium]|nr:hypothetical protein [Myxococcales bacterium]
MRSNAGGIECEDKRRLEDTCVSANRSLNFTVPEKVGDESRCRDDAVHARSLRYGNRTRRGIATVTVEHEDAPTTSARG